jgi:LPXTG-site transpeptidase (sortase) family protein
MSNFFHAFISHRQALKWATTILILCLIFSTVQPQAVLAAAYTDNFETQPFSGYPTSFTTGTATTGLSYVCNNCDFYWDGHTVESQTSTAGSPSTITITSRNGGSFGFDDIGIETLGSTITISGTGTDTFTIPVNSGDGTYGPSTIQNVDQVVISDDSPYVGFDFYFDNVNVDITNNAPEIDIQRPAGAPNSIADGGTDALGNQSISSTVNLTYTVDNSAGTDTLTVSNVTASSLSNVSGFSLDTTMPLNIPAGSTSSFDISFDVDVNGSFSFDMDVTNNDTDEGTYDITVSGTGTGGAPEIDIQRPASTSIADGSTDALGNQAIGTVNLTYTVDNTAGTDQLSITGVSSSNESNVSGFTLNTATPINIAAGSTGTFSISFDVGVNGAFSFDMDVANNDSTENPYDITVSGTGTGGVPEIDIQRPAGAPNSIADGGTDALGNQSISSSVNLTYTVDNSAGTDTLTVSNVTASGESNVSGFSLDTTMPLNIPAGSTDTFDISFDVDVNGAFSFDMDVTNNDSDEGTYDITVSGTGTGGAPEIDIQRPAGAPNSITDGGADALGNQAIGTVNLTYTVDNTAGTDQLSISGVTSSNESNVSGFTLNTATPINIAAGSTGSFSISFDVGINGAFSFDMDIANNDSTENPYDITVSGTGTGGTPEIDIQRPAGAPNSIADGGTDALGSQPVGTVNLTYTVDNSTGTDQLSITGVTAANLTNASGFSLSTATPINIAAGDTGSFAVSFSVPAAGAFSLDMDVTNNDTDEANYDIAITGTGYIEPEIAVSYNGTNISDGDSTPSTTDGTDFGQDLINYLPYSPEHTFTITNSGAGTLILTNTPRVNLTGTDFALVTDAPTSIAPGANATFVVRFAATSTGAGNGSISIDSNDTDENPFNFSITGTGYSGPLMAVQGGSPAQTIANGDTTPNSTDDTEFGASDVSGGTVDHTFTIQNYGDGALALGGSPIVSIGGSNASDFSVTSQPGTPISAGSNDTFTIQFDPSAVGNRTATVTIQNDDPNSNPYTFSIQGQGNEFEVMMGGNTDPTDGEVLSNAPGNIRVQFTREALADGSAHAANYINNYLLVEDGINGAFDTLSCAGGLVSDDTQIAISSINYNSLANTATLTVNSADFISNGQYRLFVCGTTSIYDIYGNELNGGASDTTVSFTISAASSGTVSTVTSLPATGFPVGKITTLPNQPAEKQYSNSDMVLEIPALGIELPIVGVPLIDDAWDVSWLTDEAGYLYGTAYPTWKGNTVITGHVWDALNQPGPFARLKELHYGDLIKIHYGKNTYVYEIHDTRLYNAASVHSVTKHEDLDWVTLVTCEEYLNSNDTYAFRRVIRAVLVQVISN